MLTAQGSMPVGEVSKPRGQGPIPLLPGSMLRAQGSQLKVSGVNLGAQGAMPRAQGQNPTRQGSKPQAAASMSTGQGSKPRAQASKPRGQGLKLGGQGSNPRASGPDPTARGSNPSLQGSIPTGVHAPSAGSMTIHIGEGMSPAQEAGILLRCRAPSCRSTPRRPSLLPDPERCLEQGAGLAYPLLPGRCRVLRDSACRKGFRAGRAACPTRRCKPCPTPWNAGRRSAVQVPITNAFAGTA